MSVTTNTAATTTATVAQLLNPLVAELSALSLVGKQAHWHVRGGTFLAVHEYLDTLVDDVREWADTVAERVVALGAPTDGRPAIAASAATAAYPEGFVSTEQTLDLIVEALDKVIALGREAQPALGEADAMSEDVVIEVLRGLDKHRWFFDAQRG
ncbi:DNA starvation/stationary phase protection protein [Saxibacter everestensis]|uniref:DNA starvation/stationary phase protection protein n=1 Tax=Saxibacter everestensis TaxID=2909229 RepID=A0ABY8QN81_9MICO|nr:DNA starvation/stationary phase protection protein [Brevibacteriaceae bacterium ZFBP1038]